jgi:hypothetical protein
MAIIRQRSFGDFTVRLPTKLAERVAGGATLNRIDLLEQVTADVQPAEVEVEQSPGPRGIAMKSLKLTREFESFMKRLFSHDNDVYFVSIAYDISREQPVLHPPKGASRDDAVIEIAAGDTRQFGGEGALIFPQRKVSAGIAVRLHLWESDKSQRNFGKALEEVVKVVDESKLTSTLKLVALAGGPTTATLAVVEEAAVELSKVVAAVLKSNSDDYVDFFEGYYPVSIPWDRTEHLVGHGSEIDLSLFS